MNDIEEVRFGVIQGNEMVLARQELVDACKAPERAQLFKNSFAYFFNRFADEHILDTYVFCLSITTELTTMGDCPCGAATVLTVTEWQSFSIRLS